MQQLEFFIEPFSEGRPGQHVRAALDAVAAAGGEVEFGAFSSTCVAGDADMPRIVSALLAAAFEHGATNVRLSVERLDIDQPAPSHGGGGR